MTPANPSVLNTNIFFTMGVAGRGGYSPNMPQSIENAADVTAGPYWNDIPAVGDGTQMPCVKSGELIGAALYLKAGTVLDYESKTSYTVAVQVDDSAVGAAPDAVSEGVDATSVTPPGAVLMR